MSTKYSPEIKDFVFGLFKKKKTYKQIDDALLKHFETSLGKGTLAHWSKEYKRGKRGLRKDVTVIDKLIDHKSDEYKLLRYIESIENLDEISKDEVGNCIQWEKTISLMKIEVDEFLRTLRSESNKGLSPEEKLKVLDSLSQISSKCVDSLKKISSIKRNAAGIDKNNDLGKKPIQIKNVKIMVVNPTKPEEIEEVTGKIIDGEYEEV